MEDITGSAGWVCAVFAVWLQAGNTVVKARPAVPIKNFRLVNSF
jgi:hypothetical protein